MKPKKLKSNATDDQVRKYAKSIGSNPESFLRGWKAVAPIRKLKDNK